MGLIERLATDASSLGGALRTLRMTTRSPSIRPASFRSWSRSWPTSSAMRRRCSPTASHFTYRELVARSNRYARWALGAGPRQGRHGLSDDAEPARIHGRVARRDAHRRRGRAAQHQSDWHGARPLHQRGRAEAHHRRGRTARALAGARAHVTSGAELWLHGDAGRRHPAAHRPRVDGSPATR